MNAGHIHLPPLRERPEDLAPLAHYFLNRLGYPDAERAIDDELLKSLASRRWSGNIREFRNAVEHAAVVARGRPLLPADFPPHESLELASLTDGSSGSLAEGTASNVEHERVLDQVLEQLVKGLLAGETVALHDKFLRRVEPLLLRMIMQHTGNNKARAAEMLGIHRGTLRERLRQYGLDDHEQ